MIKIDDSQVYLEPIEHKYIHKVSGKKYKSVTTAIKMIEPHFDAEGISLAITKQLNNVKQERYIGLSQQQILDYWQELNDIANEYGTLVHSILEKYILAKEWYFPPATKEGEFEQLVIDAYNLLKIDKGIYMKPERIMYNENYEIAGMSDLVIDISDTHFDLVDYKTNKVFNFYNPFGFESLLPPFNHLQNCQWSIYSIQLSIYVYLYELETGKKCRQIYVLYWDKEVKVFNKINIMFMKKEAIQLLEMHKYNELKC